MEQKELAATALRIVFFPNTWTRVASSFVEKSLNNETGMLCSLERSGYVDIYTDAKEVERLEALGIDPATVIEKPVAAEAVTVTNNSGSDPKYFDMSMMPQAKKATVGPIGPVTTQVESTGQINKIMQLVQQQMESQLKQNEVMTKMMEVTTKMMEAFSKQE
jgi:hypothetical protein